MVGESDLVKLLRAQFARLDEATLEAIASRGLLRRARKDYGAGAHVELAFAGTDAIKLRVADATVTFTEAGLAKASCTCPSSGVCRHMLVACFWLTADKWEGRELPPHDADSEGRNGKAGNAQAANADSHTRERAEERITVSGDGLLELTFDDLVKQADKKTVRDALELLAVEADCAISDDAGAFLSVFFSRSNATVRFIAGANLGGSVCTCRASGICRHRVAALFAYGRMRGVVKAEAEAARALEQVAPRESKEAPRSRLGIVAASKRLLEECVEVGICHLSVGARDRFSTLAVSALGVELPRLALALRGLGDRLALMLARDARADEEEWLRTAARAYALSVALERAGATPRAELVGRHRTRYEEVGALELSGVGAYPWTTRSGYAGLTVLFWEAATKRWHSWSDSRPIFGGGKFDSQARFLQEMPWQGLDSPAQASRSHFKLTGALRNGQYRLSSSTQSRAVLLGDTDPSNLHLNSVSFDDWDALRDHAASTHAHGLKEHEPLRRIVVVRPVGWGKREYDETTQTFSATITDIKGGKISLTVPFNRDTDAAIKRLEAPELDITNVKGVLARLNATGATLTLEPLSLFYAAVHDKPTVLNFTLDEEQSVGAAAASKAAQISSQSSDTIAPLYGEEMSGDFEEGDVETNGRDALPMFSFSALEEYLADLERELHSIAERGAASLDERTRSALEAIIKKLDAVGLTTVTAAVRQLLSSNSNAGSSLLRAIYLCLLSSELKGGSS